MNKAEKYDSAEDIKNDSSNLLVDAHNESSSNEVAAFEQETPTFAGEASTEPEQGTTVEDTSPALPENQFVSTTPDDNLPLESKPQMGTQVPVEKPEPVSMTIEPGAPTAATSSVVQQSGGILVLQWLTYAFWFWLSVSISWLAGVVINYYIANKGSSEIVWSTLLAYPLASVIITFLIAFVADKFYSKHEPAKKVGGANVIMLLHVVPFVLLAIGALITLVFALITMFLNSDPVNSTDGPLQVLLVALIVAILFTIAAARVFYGARRVVRLASWGILAILSIGFIITGFTGPAADSFRTKDDRLIEQSLSDLAEDIRQYTLKKNELPEKLSDVTHADSSSANAVQTLIDKNLVTYKANTLPVKHTGFEYPGSSSDDLSISSSVGTTFYTTGADRFYYQLCVVYKNEKKDSYNYTASDKANYTIGTGATSEDDYTSPYVTAGIAAHPAGNVCYNLYAEGKYKYSN